MNWTNIKGVATYGNYEVRVVERLASNSRPIRWAIFKDGNRVTPTGQEFRGFSDARGIVERLYRAEKGGAK